MFGDEAIMSKCFNLFLPFLFGALLFFFFFFFFSARDRGSSESDQLYGIQMHFRIFEVMKMNTDNNLFLMVLAVTCALFLWLLEISHNLNDTSSCMGNTLAISVSVSQLQNAPLHLSLLLIIFSDWSKEVSKSCFL